MEKMSRGMAAGRTTANFDHGFANMMAKQHQAAIDMAQIKLEHRRYLEIRRTAQELIQKQSKEMTGLRT